MTFLENVCDWLLALQIVDNDDARMTCTDCFLYAGGGFGFEFETSYAVLAYMKIWLEAEFSMSINIDIQAKAQPAAQAPSSAGNASASNESQGNASVSDDRPTINYWPQEGRRNVDISKITPAKFSKTKKVLKKDLVFMVSCICTD